MTKIPEAIKNYLKNDNGQFNKDPMSVKAINSGLLALTKKAVGNAIQDSEPYTIRINFQNGRIVGSEAQPRLSVELLDGHAATSTFDIPSDETEVFLEYKYLMAEGYPAITNGDSWVARAKMDGDTIKSVFVNHDFDEDDRKIIETAMLRGFKPPERM